VLPIEIQQIELQILGAHRRRDQALQELNNQQRQIEHATELQDFLRDKFTSAELYLWLQKETAALHARMYELALASAREAQRAYNFERGYTTRRFIPDEPWDSLHQGLLAGAELEFALRHMEKAYLDENRREHELTKHISLRLQFPAAYLRLRTTGYCEIDVPEWMFDLDYPGHYLRRIKNVTLTLPCVAGPYTGVHCRLTLLSSMTRIDPANLPPAQHCCPDDRDRSGYEPCPQDPRIVREYAARESIATSSGQNDSGMFELNFRDERYLPFEYLGAVSRWRIELPPENNYFDLDTLSDVILHLNYTSREGGDMLRAAASQSARGRLPGDGLRLFDVRHDFPDAWPALREPDREDHRKDHRESHREGHRTDHREGHQADHREGRDDRRRLRLSFTAAMFPFIPGHRVRGVDRLVLVFAAPGAVPGHHHLVRLCRDEPGRDEPGRDDITEFTCVADEAWPGFFFGAIDLRERPLGPLRAGRPAGCTVEIPLAAGEVSSAYVIAHYDAERWPQAGSR
jgi:Tc toxin complex TcA C-terminal TcB-binding domain